MIDGPSKLDVGETDVFSGSPWFAPQRMNIEATRRHRAEMRTNRLAKARPVSEWIASERGRVEKADFAPEVKKMYASAIKLSSRFTKDFSDFWNVDAKSIFIPGAKQ